MPGFFWLALSAGCTGPQDEMPAGPDVREQGMPARLSLAGHVEADALDEISGMARSAREAGLYWVHNDSGDKARLHAIDGQGRYRGRLKLDDADNDDWEDLASFSLDGQPFLLVADIGNNEGRRSQGTLYVVAEPDLAADDRVSAKPAWRIDFRYPDGPRDAEAVLVDATEQAVYLLSKRDLPPVLYRLPLRPPDGQPVTAERLGPLPALPQPPRSDVEIAALSNDWYWQPTAMDAGPDDRFVVVLTYGAVYYFRREPGMSVVTALHSPPLRFRLRNIRNAEAIAANADGQQLFVTVEAPRAPLFRIDLAPAPGE